MKLRYEAIQELSPAEADEILARGDSRELLYVPVSVGLYAEDGEWAQEVCFHLAHHPDEVVRGNALLGLAHIARVHGGLDRGRARPLIVAGLSDASEWVRGKAHDAADDTGTFLGWRIRRPANGGTPQ